MAESTLFI